MATKIRYLIDLLFICLLLLLFQRSSATDNSTSIDSTQLENDTFSLLDSSDEGNSTLVSELQTFQERNATTSNENPLLKTIQRPRLETATTPATNLIKNSTVPTRKNATQPAQQIPIRLKSQSKINQLLDAIDSRLKNASMVLDSHVLVMHNSDGAVNVTRTWSFQPNKLKAAGPLPFNRTVMARIPLSRPFSRRRLSSHMSRFGQPMQYMRKCERLTEQQKYMRLQNVGGLNQQYMANSPAEAAKNFPHLLPSYDDPSTSMFSDTTMFSDASDFNRPVDPIYCDEQCEEIRSKLEEVLLDETLGSRHTQRRQFFDGTSGDESAATEDMESMPETRPKPSRRGCRLERFIPIGNCTSRGEEEFWEYEKLCSACQGVFMLSSECFPTFLNSVICDKHETACIFDRYTGAAQGKCRTKKLNFKVMRNKGSKECEDSYSLRMLLIEDVVARFATALTPKELIINKERIDDLKLNIRL